MKKSILYPVLALFVLLAGTARSQDWPEEYLGLPGDNLNLYAVMHIFQQSETLEAFERSLNDPDQMINNLDLNGDNYVDYLMVFDYKQGDIHHIVLRVALNQYEYQDVAVFTVQRFHDGTVQIQLIGDEALYGPGYIIEPHYAERPNPGYRGNVRSNRSTTVITTTTYEVATWPVIVYIYQPTYVVWRSRWHYGYYPIWWNPWRVHYWHYYYGYHYHYHVHYYAYYRPWRHHRCGFYKNYYITNVRHHSTYVTVNINSGRYRSTYSRPDMLAEGERRFNQRNPEGRPMPVQSTNELSAEQKSRPANSPASVTETSNRPASTTRTTNETRPAEAARPTEVRRPSETARPVETPATRQQVRPESSPQRSTTTPARATSTEPSTNTRPQATENRNQQRNSAPSPAVERPQSRNNNPAPAVQSTPPARSNNRNATSAQPQQQNNRSSSVGRSNNSSSSRQPAASNSGSRQRNSEPAAVRTERNSNNRQSTGSQPSRENNTRRAPER